MPKPFIFSILLNFGLTVVFVFANNWALQNQLEETFLSLALLFGLAVIIGNAIFVCNLKK